jgi:uncharacterized protein (DUF2384 family)
MSDTTTARMLAVNDTILLLERLTEYYETPRECLLWFRAPQPLLEDETPITLIAQGKASELHRVWDALDHGAYL